MRVTIRERAYALVAAEGWKQPVLDSVGKAVCERLGGLRPPGIKPAQADLGTKIDAGSDRSPWSV